MLPWGDLNGAAPPWDGQPKGSPGSQTAQAGRPWDAAVTQHCPTPEGRGLNCYIKKGKGKTKREKEKGVNVLRTLHPATTQHQKSAGQPQPPALSPTPSLYTHPLFPIAFCAANTPLVAEGQVQGGTRRSPRHPHNPSCAGEELQPSRGQGALAFA